MTAEQRHQARAARERGLQPQDLVEIPPIPPERARRVFRQMPPVPERKRQLTIRLDADVFDWLRGLGKGYQTRLNALLREMMLASRSRQR